MPAQPVITTDRLELRPLSDDHLAAEIELDADAEVLRFLYPAARTREQTIEAHRRRVACGHEVPGLGFWFGFHDGDPVGWWLLRPPNGPDQPMVAGEAELGYRLMRRHWRRGFASEGSRALVRHGFETVGLTRIFAQTMAVNTGSRATMTSIGMTFARAFPSSTDDEQVPGAEQGEVEYELTRARYVAGPA